MINSTVFFVLISISFILIGSSIRYYYYGYFYKNWEIHNGKITKSSINKGIDAELNDVYFSIIEYEFRIGEKIVTANCLRLGIPTSSKSSTERILNSYPLEKNIDVFYNAATKKSILEKGVTDGTHFMLLIGILTLIVAVTVIK
jgi:hypothetical protein